MVIVAEINPLKQGLKQFGEAQLLILCNVAEINPLKQGLKQTEDMDDEKEFLGVAEINPLKQGLKQYREIAGVHQKLGLQR